MKRVAARQAIVWIRSHGVFCWCSIVDFAAPHEETAEEKRCFFISEKSSSSVPEFSSSYSDDLAVGVEFELLRSRRALFQTLSSSRFLNCRWKEGNSATKSLRVRMSSSVECEQNSLKMISQSYLELSQPP